MLRRYQLEKLFSNTSISGYQEIITDPSYAKQIIAFTHPHIGNTGINDEDNESDSIFASGNCYKGFAKSL